MSKPEVRAKLSLASRGRILNPGVCAAMSARMLGKPRTAEEKRKISESLMGHVMGSETRRKLSEARTGRPLPREVREKISQSNFGKRHSPESIERMRILAAERGALRSAEVSKRVSKLCKMCDVEKPMDEFRVMSKGNRHSYCHICLNEYNKKRRLEKRFGVSCL